MEEVDIDADFSELRNDFRVYEGINEFSTLGDLDFPITKFSNVTLGNDKIEYGLIGARDITPEGVILFNESSKSLKYTGSKKGVEKYKINKGDIILTHTGRTFRSPGVVTEEPTLPYVGHHGLMKISCGADNLELAFLIKDYISRFNISSYTKDKISAIDVLEKIPIPIIDGKLLYYKDPAMKFRACRAKARRLDKILEVLTRTLLNNGLKGDRDTNKKLYDQVSIALDKITEAVDIFGSWKEIINSNSFERSSHAKSDERHYKRQLKQDDKANLKG